MVKGEYYQIGEVSKITGISKDTLQFLYQNRSAYTGLYRLGKSI